MGDRCWIVNFNGTDLRLDWETYKKLTQLSIDNPVEAAKLATSLLEERTSDESVGRVLNVIEDEHGVTATIRLRRCYGRRKTVERRR